VFRDSNGHDLPKSEWYFVDVISCAAIKNPDVIIGNDGKTVYEREKDVEEMVLKVCGAHPPRFLLLKYRMSGEFGDTHNPLVRAQLKPLTLTATF
jgi:hypothetical protein